MTLRRCCTGQNTVPEDLSGELSGERGALYGTPFPWLMWRFQAIIATPVASNSLELLILRRIPEFLCIKVPDGGDPLKGHGCSVRAAD